MQNGFHTPTENGSVSEESGGGSSCNKSMDIQTQRFINLQKKLHESVRRNEEIEADLEDEKSSRAKLEKLRDQMKKELDELNERLERTEADQTQQKEAMRRKDQEINNLKHSLNESKENSDYLFNQQKKKHKETTSALDEQIEGLTKFKLKYEKEIVSTKLEMEDMQADLDTLLREKDNAQRLVAKLERQLQTERQDIHKLRDELEQEYADRLADDQAIREQQQLQIEELSITLDEEVTQRMELERTNKRLEMNLEEAEQTLEQCDEERQGLSKNMKKLQQQMNDVQRNLNDEARLREDLQDDLMQHQKKVAGLVAENDDLMNALDSTDKNWKGAEIRLQEADDTLVDFERRCASFNAIKRKLESEISSLREEIQEYKTNLKNSNEKVKRATNEITRLQMELESETDNAKQSHAAQKNTEAQLKALQQHIDELEEQTRKQVSILEGRISQLIEETEKEKVNSKELRRQNRQYEIRCTEILQQNDEYEITVDKLNMSLGKLQKEVKSYKSHLEEIEDNALSNLSKFKQLQTQTEQLESETRSSRRGSFSGGLSARSLTPLRHLMNGRPSSRSVTPVRSVPRASSQPPMRHLNDLTSSSSASFSSFNGMSAAEILSQKHAARKARQFSHEEGSSSIKSSDHSSPSLQDF